MKRTAVGFEDEPQHERVLFETVNQKIRDLFGIRNDLSSRLKNLVLYLHGRARIGLQVANPIAFRAVGSADRIGFVDFFVLHRSRPRQTGLSAGCGQQQDQISGKTPGESLIGCTEILIELARNDHGLFIFQCCDRNQHSRPHRRI